LGVVKMSRLCLSRPMVLAKTSVRANDAVVTAGIAGAKLEGKKSAS
jgi:hypothetical protein